MHTPTAEDALRKEAVDLATDLTSLMIGHQDSFEPESAYQVAMECVRAADRIQKARRAHSPQIARRLYIEARTSTQRAMFSLDRAGAHATLPEKETLSAYSRLHFLAMTLTALANLTR
ncbi:MAG: hypothetical protein ACYTDX_09650 [Planctomycetota bacterium]